MKFIINKSSDFYHEKDYEKEINSFDELKDFQVESGYALIINFEGATIEIYDTLRE